MLNMKHYFSLKYPSNYYLCAKANEEDTDTDINLMGIKLANEVKNFVKIYTIKGSINRISFVGHSMGGLIIRAALPYLQEYRAMMGCYMTVSTPHLGVNKGDSRLVEFGRFTFIGGVIRVKEVFNQQSYSSSLKKVG